MIDLNITENEKTYLRLLKTLFMAGSIDQRDTTFRNELQTVGADLGDYRNFRVVMGIMEEYGAIKDVHHGNDGRGNAVWFCDFQISPKAVLLVRELEELERKAQEPSDVVTQVVDKARRHPRWAYFIIGFFVLTAAVGMIASVVGILVGCVQILVTFGAITTPSPPAPATPTITISPTIVTAPPTVINQSSGSQPKTVDAKQEEKQLTPQDKDSHAPDR